MLSYEEKVQNFMNKLINNNLHLDQTYNYDYGHINLNETFHRESN